MSDTSGLPNTNADGVPIEDEPERFEGGAPSQGQETQDAQAAEPAETEPGQGDTAAEGATAPEGAAAAEGATAPEGAEDVTDASTTGTEAAEPPPADFDPAQQPSNPDLVKNTEPPD
ncbi:hypothetical protein ACFVWR_08325 [Leifsonia sp. NPDC058292]|uniref:hypothetical protein n=1 Tax=Leifsonia sp. NPDC058292 TaxID=3346428 RepID=UPI0036DAE378